MFEFIHRFVYLPSGDFSPLFGTAVMFGCFGFMAGTFLALYSAGDRCKKCLKKFRHSDRL